MRSEVKFNKNDARDLEKKKKKTKKDDGSTCCAHDRFSSFFFIFLPFHGLLLLPRESGPSLADEHKRHAVLPKKATKNGEHEETQ